jgi:TolA-binding protein
MLGPVEWVASGFSPLTHPSGGFSKIIMPMSPLGLGSLVLLSAIARLAPAEEPSPAATRQYAVAVGFQDRGLTPLAIEEWRKFLAEFGQDPRRDKARHALGVCLFREGKIDEAIAELETLRKEHPQYAQLDAVLLNLGLAHARKGESKPDELDTARREFEALLQKFAASPLAPKAALARAEVLERANKRAEAAEAYAKLARDYPQSELAPEALYGLGIVQAARQKPDAAAAAFAEFLQKFPGHVLAEECRVRQGDALLAQKKYAEAEPLFAHAAATPGFAQVDYARQQQAECRFGLAESALQAKRWAEADARLAELLATFARSPHVEEAKVHRGLALLMQRKLDEAATLLSAELPRLKDRALQAEAHFLVGRIRAEQGKLDAATTAFRTALDAKPDWPRADEARLHLAICLRLAKQADAAVVELEELVKRHPSSPLLDQAFLQLGDCEAAEGKLDASLGHYREAARRDSASLPLAQLGIARVLYRKGDPAGAIDAAGTSLQKAPAGDTAPQAHYVRGLAEHKLGQDAKALEDLQAFLAAKPSAGESIEAKFLMALCQSALGRHEAAVESFHSVANAAPKGQRAAECHFRAGEALYALGKSSEAKAAYEASLTLNPPPELEERALHKLGWCAFRAGNWKEAAAAFAHQLHARPEGTLAAEATFMEAESLAKAGDWPAALDRFRKRAAGSSSDLKARALFRVGQGTMHLKDWPASATAYSDLLAAFPSFDQAAEARYGLAWALQNQEQYAKAIALFEQVTHESGTTEIAAKAQFMIGECYFAEKKHAEAARQFLKGAFAYPFPEWVGNCHFEAARCFEVLRQLDQARQSYQILVSKYPKHDKAKAAAERLKELGG